MSLLFMGGVDAAIKLTQKLLILLWHLNVGRKRITFKLKNRRLV